MTVAQVKNISRVQGDTYPVECTILKSDSTPYNLTDVTEVKLGVAEKKVLGVSDPPTFVVTGTITDALNGIVEFPITANEADIAIKKYYGEIQFLENTYTITTDQFEYVIRGQIIH